MRSILVLLILVMIGLNGKGQSVTALPDSVLSQCCLEVTLLNGNVTTVDWVFIQYITRDGTGTKLFVEYAPNFGGIQWETQIRIQDDFDNVLERSKFIVIPFTVGSTDYGINRNWIANIEENTTTGGTWIYGRFGTPTKRKFSAVEDYETMKNLLLACRPRAIVVAENGLYTEGDTVRMGGFLIENTSITTEGYNWQMKDTLSSVEFGLDYLTPETLDTTVYWARRHGSLRQMVQLGRRYYYNSMRDTTGGLYSDFTHSWNAGDPFLQYQTFNPSAPTTGTAWFKIQKDNSFLNLSNDATNPYYSLGWAVTNSTATLGASESGSGDPGNGVVMGAYGFGTTEFLFMKTKAVDAGTATNGQFLQLIDNSSGEVDFATIDLSAYLPISDTAAMLDPYIQGAGTINRVPIFTGSRVIGNSNIQDNNTSVSILNSKPFQLGQWTTAGRPAGVNGYKGRNTTTGFEEGYFTSQWENYITSIGASANWIPTFSSAGKIQGTSTFTQVSNKLTLGVPSGKNPMVDIVTGTGDGTVNEAAGLRLRNRDIDGNTFYLQLGTSTSGRGGSNQGHAYLQSGLWGGSYNNPLILMPKGGNIAIGATRPINWELSVTSNIAVSAALASASTSNTDGGRIIFNAGTVAGTPYNSAVVSIASVFDKSFWYQGLGLSFRTLSGSDISGVTTGGTERMRISSDGKVGIGEPNPQRLLHVTGEARITDLTTDTPTRFVGADADGDLGGISFSSIWRDYQTDKAILGSDSSFVHDPAQDTTRILGSMALGKPSTFGSPSTSGYQFTFRNPLNASTYMLIESGRTSPNGGNAGLRLLASGQFGGEISFGTATSSELSFYSYFAGRSLFNVGLSNFVTGNKNTTLVGAIQDPIQWDFNGRLVIYDTITSGKALLLAKKVSSSSTPIAMFSSAANDRFTFNDDGSTRFHVYGTPATTAAALSKTLSNYGVGFATDGTVTSREIKRDTTIYVVDTDYDFSAALTTAQVASRYNRVIFLMTTTAAAGSDSELTLHTPDVNLMQCEYLVRSTDEAGGFANVIRFGTNNAVDSINGLASSYFPAAGQGVGIRAGLRSGVYRYFYY